MASRAIENLKRAAWKKPELFDPGQRGECLPEAYRKFWHEWKLQKREPVHYIPEPGNWKRNPETGEVKPIQNIPIRVKFPKESQSQMWGGEGIIAGFEKRKKKARRVPHFWVPQLSQSVVYSEILNKYISLVVTNRTIDLIHKNYGFDHYVLKTPACDLQSELALKIKRTLLQALDQKNLYPDDLEKREEIYNKYKDYLKPYSKEDLEWYGLTFHEAINKAAVEEEKQKQKQLRPLKEQYRTELIETLLEKKASGEKLPEIGDETKGAKSWISKLNPFANKSQETSPKS